MSIAVQMAPLLAATTQSQLPKVSGKPEQLASLDPPVSAKISQAARALSTGAADTTATAIPVASDQAPAAAGTVGTAAIPTDRDPDFDKLKDLFDEANNKGHGKDDMSRPNWLYRLFGAKGRSYDAALRDLMSGPVTREKLANFLEDFYGANGVSKSFWAAFTGNGEDGTIDKKELIACLDNFMENAAFNGGEPLKYMCDNPNIYIIPVSGRLAGDMQKWAQAHVSENKGNAEDGVKAFLANFRSSFVKKTWANLKGGRSDGEAVNDKNVWDKFAKILAFRFWQQYPEKFDLGKFNGTGGRVRELVSELGDQYLRRWLVNEDGLKESEYRGLKDRQAALEQLAKNDPKALDGVTLDPFARGRQGETATGIMVAALDLYKADPVGNREEAVKQLASLRDLNPDGAVPVPPAGQTYVASAKTAAKPQ